jgi:uncharacterized protein (TIGR00290 family)
MRRKTLLSWSSGKDSAWALHVLRQDPQFEVVGLFSTVNKMFDRVAMHGVRMELLRQQAESAGLPLHIIQIPYPCSDAEYAASMTAFIDAARKENIECFSFGDLFLEEVRRYREKNMNGTGITPVFPLWDVPTAELSRKMVAGGLKAVITCVDPNRIPAEFAGREYDEAFLDSIPAEADPCGEYGEFHSFAYDGPMFRTPIKTFLGETVQRDGFVFTDVFSSTSANGFHEARSEAALR